MKRPGVPVNDKMPYADHILVIQQYQHFENAQQIRILKS